MENLSFIKIAAKHRRTRVHSLESIEILNQVVVNSLVQGYMKNSLFGQTSLFAMAR